MSEIDSNSKLPMSIGKIYKKVFIGLLIVFGPIIILFSYLTFKISKDSYLPELLEFNPIEFNIFSNKPIYYYSENNLFYDSLGHIDLLKEPIWTGGITDRFEKHVFVSPNSEFIAINEENRRILILNKEGEILHEIAPINKSFVDENRRSGNYWGEVLIWNKNSTKLYFMKDRIWGRKFEDDNRSSLFSYSVEDDRVRNVIDLEFECSWSYYLSSDERTLYAMFADNNGELPYKKIDLSSKKEICDIYKNNSYDKEITSDSIFVNYTIEHFGNFSHDFKHLITTVSGTNVEGGLYYYTDSLAKLLIKGKYGFGALKGNYYSFLKEGEFLPGNRFFVGRLRADEYEGTLIVDVKTKKYKYIDQKIHCFFSITSIDQPNLSRKEFEPSNQLIIEKIK